MLDFFEAKLGLVATGQTFSPGLLRQLRYPDVKRACVGDAGKAACSRETVEAELARRREGYAHLTEETLPGFTAELSILGMLDDVRQMVCRSLAAIPSLEWTGLHPQLRAYLLTRCLRAHADQPRARLGLLVTELDNLLGMDNLPQQVSGISVILKSVAQSSDTAILNGEILSLETLRTRFKGFELLQFGLPLEERLALPTIRVRGYHCTAGCFLPPVCGS